MQDRSEYYSIIALLTISHCCARKLQTKKFSDIFSQVKYVILRSVFSELLLSEVTDSKETNHFNSVMAIWLIQLITSWLIFDYSCTSSNSAQVNHKEKQLPAAGSCTACARGTWFSLPMDGVSDQSKNYHRWHNRVPMTGLPVSHSREAEGMFLNYCLTPKDGLSRSGLRHIGGTMWGSLHCCCPCCTCSINKQRTLVSRAVSWAPSVCTKDMFCFLYLFRNNHPKSYMQSLVWRIKINQVYCMRAPKIPQLPLALSFFCVFYF